MINWADPLTEVPRERFIPDRIWKHERGRVGNDLVPVDRRTDPEQWAAMVADDEPINTQVDLGNPAPDGTGREVTSSCSDRRVVLSMLLELDARPGDRVLEIGTGTGWNAAILAEAGCQVTSVEIDAELAARASELLGSQVKVIAGDGTHGWPLNSPYDRLIATVGTVTVPWPWVEQVRPGGRLVVPLNADWHSPGVAVLERTARGATGRLADPVAFMRMRDQAKPRPRTDSYVRPVERAAETDLHPHAVAGDRDAALAIGQQLAGVRWSWFNESLWLYADDGFSWARVNTADGAPYAVSSAGPREIFSEVETAYRRWVATGEPKVGDWVVVVERDGQRIELDKP